MIGSVGPTTSYRMDAYAPTLLDMGQTGMIGKGARGPEVVAGVIAMLASEDGAHINGEDIRVDGATLS